MKCRITLAGGILMALVSIATAYVTFEFSGWPWLGQKSDTIIIASCSTTPDPDAPDKNGVELTGAA